MHVFLASMPRPIPQKTSMHGTSSLMSMQENRKNNIFQIHSEILFGYNLYSINLVCRGSIMVTTSDFQSGRLGSSPCRDHYSMRLDRCTGLIRAFIPPG